MSMSMGMGEGDGKPAPPFKQEERGQKGVSTGHHPRVRGHWDGHGHGQRGMGKPATLLRQEKKKKQEGMTTNPERTGIGMGMGRRMGKRGW